MQRDELIALVKQIKATSACVTDLDALLLKLEGSVPHPDVARLIFDPPGGRDLSAEEIVELAMSSRKTTDFLAGDVLDHDEDG